ncbi:ABC transporter permease [Pseudorhodoferax soli]|uniref:Putrescine transport system permease protein n=1 Tax=Pseudorhodoferax soli TaxID=545864 RepID=A0A368XBK3_9BURK|nr:ABC transporter permease subunit [Pseudorhodoferax soli]RCW64388.1 putrescine transport system permease protein [Pseudorhodoferax soli]
MNTARPPAGAGTADHAASGFSGRRALFGPRAALATARIWLFLGYAFLFLPIVALVVFSFNDSPVPGVWEGFTFKWYAALARDREIIAGLWLSMKIAFFTACGSVVLGTLGAFTLTKYRRFRGRTLFSGMVNAPLVMPEVIVGLSLLLMLVSLQRLTGFPERGAFTIWLGHVLLGMAYATVVIQARLQELNPQLEEAAMDLGARPAQVFRLVTLPMITQSMLSAWLLTFTISLDDVVLSAFLSGPGSTTMPLVIFSRARLGLNPTVNAVATVIIVLVSIGVIVASYLIARAERERTRAMAAARREE